MCSTQLAGRASAGCEFSVIGLKCGMADELIEAGGRIRLYVAADLGESAAVPLSDGQSHYLLHVMRAKAGDRLRLFNGRDGEWAAEISAATRRGVTVIARVRTAPQTPVPDLWLCFAPVKKTPADYLTQKATELGAAKLQPVFTRRTIVTRVNQPGTPAGQRHRGTAEQSDRLSVPQVAEPVTLEKTAGRMAEGAAALFRDEGGVRQAIGASRAARARRHPHRSRRRLRSRRARPAAGTGLRHAGDAGSAHSARRMPPPWRRLRCGRAWRATRVRNGR